MNIKKTLLVLSMIAPYMSAMDNDNDVSSIQEIRDTTFKVIAHCATECNFVKDVTSACTAKCLEETFKRVENFSIRKYTNSCSGKPFTEIFNPNPTLEEQCDELSKTIKAYQNLRFNDIKACVQRKSDVESSRIAFLQEKADGELLQFQKEHPIIAKAVSIQHNVRRLEKSKNN